MTFSEMREIVPVVVEFLGINGNQWSFLGLCIHPHSVKEFPEPKLKFKEFKAKKTTLEWSIKGYIYNIGFPSQYLKEELITYYTIF
jgi:hypothetical protein